MSHAGAKKQAEKAPVQSATIVAAPRRALMETEVMVRFFLRAKIRLLMSSLALLAMGVMMKLI